MEKRLVVGTLGKAQGIKGEVKLNPLTDDVNRFKKLKEAYVDGVMLKIEHVKVLVNGVFVKFAGVDDRNTAETMKNRKVEVDRKDATKLEDGQYFIVDLIGAEVFCEGAKLGVLTNIYQHGSADVYEVTGDKNFMFPCVNGVLDDVDIEHKKIVLNAKRLEEVAVYED